MRLLGVATAYHLSCGKFSSKVQNERWMGTGRRSISDNHIFL